MDSLKTKSSPRKAILTVIFTFIPMFLLAFLGLKIAVATWLFFEIILLISFVFCLFLVSKTHWEIEFCGNNVNLLGTGRHENYYIENLTQSDLIIKQNPRQKEKDSCDLKIKNMPFGIYDVAGCKELMAYIQENLPK